MTIADLITTAEPLPAWAARQNGKVSSDDLPLSDRMRQALDELGYSFRYNLARQEIEVNGVPLSDPIMAAIRVAMRDRKFRGKDAIGDFISGPGT